MIDLQSHIDRVQGWVQQVRVANGYRTDAGANVVTETASAGVDESKLLTGVFLADLQPVQTTKQRRDWQFDIAIEARIPARSDSAEATLIAVLEDLVHCIPTATRTADDNLASLELSATNITRQPDGIPYIVASVTLRATCYEFISQPA